MPLHHDLAWDDLDGLKYADEAAEITGLLAEPCLSASERAAIGSQARDLVRAARAAARRKGAMESFLEEFGLAEAEGVALMSLAEALLRVPDADTADKLIAEKIASGDWAAHLGRTQSWLVNAGVWGLMLTGRVVALTETERSDAGAFLARLVARVGEPVVRAAALQAMRLMGEQFVLGRTIDAALKRAHASIRAGAAHAFSFDMLGEGARTFDDARAYGEKYAHAIERVSEEGAGVAPETGSGVSVKLSALHPRYEARQEARVRAELYPRLFALAVKAKAGNINFCLDAEEADRLVLSLKLLDQLSAEPALRHWDGLGLAVQAYQKRGRAVIARLGALALRDRRRLMVRLVKGAYWDGEIKRAQIAGRPDYPVFTTKPGTDVAYLACARDLIAAAPALYPQFATHNAHTALAVRAMAARARVRGFEYQRLHGMGEALYAAAGFDAPVRVYAPVGSHEDLLPYLVRRLLENGANASFVHGFLDDDVSPDLVAADPFEALARGPIRHPRLSKPSDLFGARANSAGRDLSIAVERERLAASAIAMGSHRAEASIGPESGGAKDGAGPSDDGAAQIARACAGQKRWDGAGARARAAIVRAMADRLEDNCDRLVGLIAREAGRTLQDGVDEVREAVDFCRYYAGEAERVLAPAPLPSPAGEENRLELRGRGVFVCISPWNFPLSIFTGQIAAALAAGNGVVAKPAEQTIGVAAEAVRLFHQAGLPDGVLGFVPGDGAVGARLVADPRIAGVAFTGSTETAWKINRSLAAHTGPIPVLIAETGGMNGLFVDTTALKEQVVDDAIVSAFGSAGQRCSSLRVIFLPHETADAILAMLEGALAALIIGDPADPATDIGPVIDAAAKSVLDAHMAGMRKTARVIAQRDVAHLGGTFFGPAIVELPSLSLLTRETFGPILHVVRYDPADIARVGAELAAKGYGLTLGVHSRLDSFAAAVMAAVPAGNVYVNRSMIGAVVGVQPFGGLGLSGTGPKAGGPHYLLRFASERTVTINSAARGGDPDLLSL